MTGYWKTLMKPTLKVLASLMSIAALAAACNPFAHDNSRSAGAQDPHFAPFAVSSENKPVYGNDTDYLNHRMPNLGASEGHYAQILIADSTWMPVPETKFWFSGVAVASEETIAQLQQEIEGSAHSYPASTPISTNTYPRSASSTAFLLTVPTRSWTPQHTATRIQPTPSASPI